MNGHLGRWIFNPAVYGVAGKADHVVAGAPVKHTVNAYTGLADLEYPLDFVKFRLGYAYVSGDGNPNDKKDTGFDSISDAVTLFGGPISYFVGEDIKFGTGDFVRANSFYPSLRGANGQANYVNPGLQLINGGMDVTLTPRLQLALNANYTRFNTLGAFTNSTEHLSQGRRNRGERISTHQAISSPDQPERSPGSGLLRVESVAGHAGHVPDRQDGLFNLCGATASLLSV